MEETLENRFDEKRDTRKAILRDKFKSAAVVGACREEKNRIERALAVSQQRKPTNSVRLPVDEIISQDWETELKLCKAAAIGEPLVIGKLRRQGAQVSQSAQPLTHAQAARKPREQRSGRSGKLKPRSDDVPDTVHFRMKGGGGEVAFVPHILIE